MFVGLYVKQRSLRKNYDVEIVMNLGQMLWKNTIGDSWNMEFDGKVLKKSDNKLDEAQVSLGINSLTVTLSNRYFNTEQRTAPQLIL